MEVTIFLRKLYCNCSIESIVCLPWLRGKSMFVALLLYEKYKFSSRLVSEKSSLVYLRTLQKYIFLAQELR